MSLERKGRPLLEAVARAIEANDGDHVSAEMVNAHLAQPLEETHLDRKLGDLRRDGFIEGPGINERAAPILISLAPKGRQEVSGWPSGLGGLSISGSSIENLAMRDVNITNFTVGTFFEAWERKIEELDAPPEEKDQARDRLRTAKDILTGAASGAGGRALYDAFSLLVA